VRIEGKGRYYGGLTGPIRLPLVEILGQGCFDGGNSRLLLPFESKSKLVALKQRHSVGMM
jgi:hypothetical protein